MIYDLRDSLSSLLLALATGGALIVGCGPSAPAETPPTVSTAEGPTPAPAGEGIGSESPPPAPGEQPEPTAGNATVTPVPITNSELASKVKALGIDLTKAPELGKIPLGKKKKLMPLFQKSLGMEDCTGCHVEGDFKAETENIKIARGMWNNYVMKLRMNDGSALFCDSCHNGHEHMIPRGDEDAVQKLMTEEYEGKLIRADGEEHSCSTCHTDVFETKIFENVWGIKG